MNHKGSADICAHIEIDLYTQMPIDTHIHIHIHITVSLHMYIIIWLAHVANINYLANIR